MNNLTLPAQKNTFSLSPSQKSLWIISQQDKSNPAYNLSLSYHLKGEINYGVLNKSMNILFNRQRTMFSVFKQKDGIPYIEIIPRNVNIEFIDYSNFPVETRKEKIFSFVGEDTRKCFNIETGPLYRLYLIKECNNSYYFHATFHHIIFDGWSMRLFSQDLSIIYTDLSNGNDFSLRPLTYNSYDFADLEETLLEDDNKEELVEFWKENLSGCNPELKIVYDYPRKGFSSGFGSKESLIVSEDTTKKLRSLATEANTTLYKTMLSVLGVFLQKYTGENDICIGIPISKRLLNPALEDIFGFFVGTSVARLNKETNCNFREYIRYASDVTSKAIKNSRLPFDKIVEASNPERSNLNPLFQVSFSWWNDVIVPLDLNGIIGERVSISLGVSPFDISFYLWEDGNIIRGEIEYNIDVFKQDTIIRLKNNFINLVERLAENPNENLNCVSFITESELKQIFEINNTYTDYPRDKTIVQLFEEQVNLFPEKTALEFKGETVTYKSLNSKANQLARTLIAQGVKCDMPVGIIVDKSLEMIVGILATLKAGGAYLPIDPEYPFERIEFIIKESDCKIVLMQHKYMELHLEGVNKLDLNSISTYHKDNENIGKIGKPTDLAYFMYTSGTTGMPKGSMIRNYSVVKLVRNVNYMDLSSDDSILYTSAIVFDVTTYEIWAALLNGMTLHIVEKDTILDPDALGEELFKHQITILHLTSALFTQLSEMRTDIFSKLKYLLVGGDVLSAFHINKVRNDNPELKVINCYGPSENTTYSTTFLIDKSYERNIPIGKPVSNSTIYIFDKYLNHQPVGVLGEIYVGGEGLSKGYLNREDLNSTKFMDNPYNLKERLYKTGDFGRWLPDGNIEFHGRVDNQLKIRGYRVELDEIESVISSIEGVVETVIKPIKVEEGDFRLVAFVNVSSSFQIDDKKLSRQIAEKLPNYMVPTMYKFVDSFPKTINGKIDRKALKFDISEFERRDSQDLKVLSQNEKKLLEVWQKVLKTEDILITDDFFNIGGNSLLAVRLINRIKEEFGFILNFNELILYPNIRQLCVLIDNHQEDSIKSIDLVHLNQSTNLPLTSNQKRLWLISKMDADVASYIIPYTFKFRGSLNQHIFQESIDKLFHRHHIVYSVIKEINGEPYCDIVPSNADISFIDYTGLSEKEKSEKVNDLIEADSLKAFDLSKGPLYRLYLIMTAPDEYIFHFCIHHIVFDGWSESVFANDLSEIYNSLLKGKEINLEELEFQEYDFAHWENSFAGSESEGKSIEFWKENLKDSSPLLNFPYDFQRKEQPSVKGGFESFRLSKDLSGKLRRISKTEGPSLFTVLFGAFGIQMHKYSGEDDLNIGLPVAYRPHSKLENIFGMFVNTVVVRLKYAKGQTFKEIIRQANEAAMNVMTHQDLAFDKVVEIVNPERFSNVNPLFQVAFNWLNNLHNPLKLEGITSEPITRKERASEFDITFNLWENEGFIDGEIEYNTDILKQETIVRLRDNFITLVENLIENSDAPIESVSMISDEERRIIEGFNNTHTDYPKDKTIVQLFEEQANFYPNKTAVVFKESSLTYKQLNEKTNQLARILRESGVSANTPVGIMIDKSVNMIVGIFGILKAGGGYVPIDPEYPEQRINFIIKDSGCKILLTQEKYNKLPVEGITMLDLDSENSYHQDRSNIGGINTPSDLAYIIYTSGTTGIPKGTLIPQKGVVRLIRNTNYIDYTSEDRVLQAAAIVFDASTEEIFGALLNGSSLYVVNKETILDPNEFGNVLLKNDITIVDLASALFTQIAELRTDIFSKVKKLILGGDVVSAPHVNKVRKDNPKLIVINTYGPTENSCNSTAYKIDRDFESNIPIGKPISNSTAYIFDKSMNYQPIGIIGELYVGGDGLSMGYLNREDLNKTSFIDNPCNPGERLYKTGDLARWLPDGNIEFHGRVDNQLKIRGYRVELEEIESVISNIDGVIETVIKPVKVEEGDYKLVAFLNVPETFNMDAKEVDRIIRAKLPPYMVPSAYKFMHGFKKTVNGKIDRKALNFDLIKLKEREEGNETEELTQTEKALINIWGEVLKTKDIVSTDNFFEIGGNSLLTISTASKIQDYFNIDFNIRNIFNTPRIKDLSELIDVKIKLKDNKEPISLSGQFDDFSQLVTFLQNKGYKFSIKNAVLIYDSPNNEHDDGIANAIAKHYRHLFNYYWPMPNANLTPIQPLGASDPFFIVHGEGASPVLKEIFGTELPLFDFFHQSADGSRMLYRPVEEIADFYLQQLLSIKNEGNFLLGGFSIGGIVAYEMAQRLTQMGKKVNLLIMIDTHIPGYKGYVHRFDFYNTKLIANKPFSEKMIFYLKKWKYFLTGPAIYRIKDVIKRSYCDSLLMIGKPVPPHLRPFYIVDNYNKYYDRYQPLPYKGNLHLIRAKDGKQSRDPNLGWGNYVKGNIEVISLPGSHSQFTQIYENSKVLAKTIKDIIKKEVLS
jgi:amino acid adenylation domain-containing protein